MKETNQDMKLHSDTRWYTEDEVQEIVNNVREESYELGELDGRRLHHKYGCDHYCPLYVKDHSINTDGTCNMGCC